MENSDIHNEHELRRPAALTLLGGLYLFLFIVTVSSYGHPTPFMGAIHHGTAAGVLVFVDSLICLYLFLGLMKQQALTWYLLLCYNTFEIVNTVVNLVVITPAELEKVVGEKVNYSGLLASNTSVIIAVLLLSAFIYRHRDYFTNRSKYLF